jgi:hypothetical protein
MQFFLRSICRELPTNASVKVKFSQRALNLIGSSAHHEHLIDTASALKPVPALLE